MRNSSGSRGGRRRTNRLGLFWRRSVRRWWRNYQWPVMLGLGIVVLVLGWIGFAKLFSARGEVRSWLDILYLDAQLFTLNSGATPGPKGWEFEVARVLAPILTFYAAVGGLVAIFRERFDSLRLACIRNHVVICGLGRKGLLLARQFREAGEPVVVIEQDQSDPFLDQCKDHGAIVLIGSATDREVLRKARVQKAKYLVSVCGDDGANVELAACAQELVRNRRRKPLTCFIHIVDPSLCSLLRERALAMHDAGPFRVEFFNIFDTGVRALLNQFPPFAESREPQGRAPHLVVVGAGRFGREVIVHVAREWWAGRGAAGERMRITMVDRAAQRIAHALHSRYPRLQSACDLIPQQMEVEGPEFDQAGFLFDASGGCAATAAYVCLDDNSLALTAALVLLERTRRFGMPIVVRMTDNTGIATLLQRTDRAGGFENLHAFGLLDRTCTQELLLGGTRETLARAIHEEYVRNQEQLGQTPQTNPSMVPWESLPEYLRESNRRQADGIGAKLKAVGCDLAPLTDWEAARFEFGPQEVELMAQMEHQRWIEELTAQGWTYAPGPKNAARKTHDCLVAWSQLPGEKKELDRGTVRSLPAFLARVGFQVCRVK